MGRLAVVLGSSALGPGGEAIAAAAAEHGAAFVQRHGEGAYALPHEIDHAANLRPLAEQGCDRVLAIGSVGSLRADLPVGSLVCPDDFIALHSGISTFNDAAPTSPRALTRIGAAKSSPPGARWHGSPRRGRLLADGRPPFRDPGGDPPDRRARRPGRDDDRLGVRSRRRAGPRLRGDLHGRQPRQRDRPGALSVAELEADREANATLLRDGLQSVLRRLVAVGLSQ